MASTRAAANLARTRPTNSLLSGICNCTGGFGVTGAAGFGGAAPGGAVAAGLEGGVAAELLAGLSPAGTGEGCCSLGSSAIDLCNAGCSPSILLPEHKDPRTPVASNQDPDSQTSIARVSNTRQKPSQSQELWIANRKPAPDKSRRSRPLQRALFVQPHVSDQQNSEEHEHRNERKKPHMCHHPAAVQNRPRNQKHRLHVKHHKQHGDNVKPHRISSAGAALRGNATFVRL